MLYLSAWVGRTTICNALGLGGNQGQERDAPPQRPWILRYVNPYLSGVAQAHDPAVGEPVIGAAIARSGYRGILLEKKRRAGS
jgi:hypothetical protein